MTRRVARTASAVALGTALVAGTAGCGFHGVYSLPLPGAAANGGDTYTVNVQLADVLDLVPYSAVKVQNATVGHVTSIKVEGHHALVGCRLPNSVRLPANAVAQVEQTSVLGEKFVEIEPPRGVPAQGRLADGDVIPLSRTGTDATVEEVLGALSMLLNGGGIDQLHTITHELNVALTGRTGAARDLLDQLGTFVGGLDAQKAQIVRAIEGLDHFSRVVRAQESALVGAVEQMPAALKVLSDDRTRLVRMLTSVRRLGVVAGDVITRSQADLVSNLRALRPTLDRLSRVAQVIPDTLSVLITYPTADSVENEYFGDYGNLALTVDLSKQSLLQTFGPQLPVPLPGAHQQRRGPSTPSVPSTPSTPSAPGVPLPSTSPVPSISPLFGITRWSNGRSIDDLLMGAMS